MYNQQPINSNPGTPHVGVTQQVQRPSGMPCPQCKGFIPVSMQQIITESSIFCPHCGLRLNINHQESQPAIEALKKFQQAQSDFDRAAMLLDCEPAALKAVKKAETGDKGGFLPSGRPTILFDGHIFWQQLRTRGINPQRVVTGNEDILYPKWTKAHYKGGEAEYKRLLRARHINEDAANASASWGMFQIMGFNYAACGEPSVASFVRSMYQSECRQLLLGVRFIKGNRSMLAALQKKDWKAFARLYNGPAYAQNRYDEKLSTAYSSFKHHTVCPRVRLRDLGIR